MARDDQQNRGLPARRGEYGMTRPGSEESLFSAPFSALGSPFSMMRRIFDDMDRWFGGGMGATGGGMGATGVTGLQGWAPSIDFAETENEFILRADLPGVEPEDLEVYCGDNALTLRGETRREEERQTQGWHRSERLFGRFERVIPLPAEVDREQIQANFRNGVLEIRLPKTEQGRQRMRRIPIQGGRSLAGTKGGEAGDQGQEATGMGQRQQTGASGTQVEVNQQPESKESKRK